MNFELNGVVTSNITRASMIEIEALEKSYLNEINFIIASNIDKIMVDLNSKDEIRNDWIRSTARSTGELARGAERIFYSVFSQFGVPNSSPIGSDLFFETHDAFIHIDIKSVQKKNRGDFKGQFALEKNQTSYSGNVIPESGDNIGQIRPYRANLPHYYTKTSGKCKICLTYFIAIFYDVDTLEIEWIKLVCMPNGLLYNIYQDRILGAGKLNSEIRYRYKNNETFNLLQGNPDRVKVLYWNHNMSKELEKYFSNLKSKYDNQELL